VDSRPGDADFDELIVMSVGATHWVVPP